MMLVRKLDRMQGLPSSTDIAIVGAGAAGLALAIFARRANPGIPVVLLDSARKPGAKILVSGGGRCNVTNAVVTEADFWGGKPTIVRRILRAMPVDATVRFFADLGVALHEEAGGKLFPDTNRARDILDALLHGADAAGAALVADTRVAALRREDGGFVLETNHGDPSAAAGAPGPGGQALPQNRSDRRGHPPPPTPRHS